MTIEIIPSELFKPFVNLCLIVGLYISTIRPTNAVIEEQTPSAWEFYNRKSIEVQAKDRDVELNRLSRELEEIEEYNLTHRRKKKHPWIGVIVEHGKNCECCTPPNIVKRNEEIWEEKWAQIQKQKREIKKVTKKEEARQDRWNREFERFKEWQRKWGFYYRE